MTPLLTLLATAPLLFQTGTPPAPTPATTRPTVTERAQARALDSLRELLELDLDAEAAERGLVLTDEGGLLVASDEAAALTARALFESGREEQATAFLAARAGDDPAGWLALERARIALARDELETVEGLLADPARTDLPVRYPQRPESWFVLASARARAGELTDAARLALAFTQRLPLDGDAAAAWNLVALASDERGNAADAAEARRRANDLRLWHAVLRARRIQVRESPGEPEPRLGVALAWMEARRPDEALPVLVELCELFPDYARGWFHLGEVERMRGDLDGARRAWSKALAIDPAYHKARFNRAVLDTQRQELARAQVDWDVLVADPAASIDPLFLDAHLYLARVLAVRGEQSAALESYERYRTLGGAEPLDPARAQRSTGR